MILLLLFSCISKTDENIFVSLSTDELAIINQIIGTINKEKSIIIISENLEVTLPVSNNRKKEMSGVLKYLKKTKNIDNDLIRSFERNNNNLMTLDSNIIFDFNFIWNKQYEASNEINYYGKITVSRIGFNKEQTRAMMYIGIMSEGVGKGDYYIVEKENNKWKIINIIPGWIT
jgi:hypothetical protein